MAKQILINVAPWESRVALLEDTQLLEMHIERRSERGIAGNLYTGVVSRVLPGMEAAFVDIGLEKAAFLHVSDLAVPDDEGPPPEVVDAIDADAVPLAGDTPSGGDDLAPPRRVHEPIAKRVKKGDVLLTQVSKEPIGTKGARVTAQLSLPGRYLVYMPGTRHIGISRRIEDAEERERLRTAAEAERPDEGGLIIRTACEGVSKREIHDDVRYLTRLWAHVRETASRTKAPALVHADLDLVLRAMRDLFTADIDRVVVDTREDYLRVREFAETFMPRLASRVHFYQGTTPLFEQHGVEAKIARALDRRVWLKSGGYLVFDQTESLTTVDVNTGRYVGKRNQEETVFRTNLEAATQVMDQLRVRNIGGIIVIDFIDMDDLANRKKVFDTLLEAAKKDKTRSNALRISEMGLVQMTRKRTRDSLGRLLTEACPHCHGSGRVRSAETIAYDALRQLQRESAIAAAGATLVLRVHPEVAAFLAAHRADTLEPLGERLERRIEIEALETLARDAFDIGHTPS